MKHSEAKLIFILFVAVLAGGILFSSGKKDGRKNEAGLPPTDARIKDWEIVIGDTAKSGECIAVTLTSRERLTETAVLLLDPSGKIRARASPFTTPDSPTPPASAFDPAQTPQYSETALIALSTFLESGIYSVEVKAVFMEEKVSFTSPVFIESGTFGSEKISLNKKNSAIKADTSPERMRQIRDLNDILFEQNPYSFRYPGPFKAPLDSMRRTSEFGDRRIYLYSNGAKVTNVHYGIDFGVPSGTPVFSSGDGFVVFAEKRISTGWTVAIEHFPGVYSLYYHLDALLASKGELVRAGTLIARSGNTGLSTGPHLHWEFRVNGEAVSPDWFVSHMLF